MASSKRVGAATAANGPAPREPLLKTGDSMSTLPPRAEPPPRPRQPARPAHGTCRLTLTINGTPYRVRPVPADSFAAIRAFRLRKADGTAYDVAETVHGHECDCPDFVFHRDGI